MTIQIELNQYIAQLQTQGGWKKKKLPLVQRNKALLCMQAPFNVATQFGCLGEC